WPVATDISTATRAGTLIGFDVADSDWPLKASFVLFMRNVIEQARMHRAHGVTGPARAGDPLRVLLPATATSLEATGPAGDRVDASLRAGLAIVPATDRAGFYRLAWQGAQAGTLVVPANLTSEPESDVRPKPIAASDSDVRVSSGPTRPEAHTEW